MSIGHTWKLHGQQYPHVRRFQRSLGSSFKQMMAVRCSHCLKEIEALLCPFDTFAKVLFNKGWSSPGDPKAATCPDCTKSIKEARLKQREDEESARRKLTPAQKRAAFCRIADVPRKATPAIPPPVTSEAPMTNSPPKADAPRTATPEDNRRILEVLEAHYMPDRRCYKGSGSDAAVASTCDVPRAWVAAIRTTLFGPDVNEVSLNAPNVLAAHELVLKNLMSEAMGLAERVEAELRLVEQYRQTLKAAS